MVQLGNGLTCSIEMMSQAIMAQVMANTNPRPANQNLFYGNQGFPVANAQYPPPNLQQAYSAPTVVQQNNPQQEDDGNGQNIYYSL